jgi:hypothetical protein
MALLFDEYDRLIPLARSGFTGKPEVSAVLLMSTAQTVLFVTSAGGREPRAGKAPATWWAS